MADVDRCTDKNRTCTCTTNNENKPEIPEMSHVMRKPVFGRFDQVRLKLASSVTEDIQSNEIMDLLTIGIIQQFKQQITKALIRLFVCTG